MNDAELILRRKRQNADRARAYRKRKKDPDAMPSTSTVQSDEPVSEKLLHQKQLNAERCRRYRQKCKQLKFGANFNQGTSDSDTSTSRDTSTDKNVPTTRYDTTIVAVFARYIEKIEFSEMSEDITLRNARNCKKYYTRKKSANPPRVVRKTTNSEKCRQYRQRKKLLAQQLQSKNEVVHTPSTSSLQMTFEPQLITTGGVVCKDNVQGASTSRNSVPKPPINNLTGEPDILLVNIFKKNNCAMSAHVRLSEKEISIKAPWGNIAALSWGDPLSPPVLLCHGKLDTCSGFRPLVSLLPKNFYYISVDLPGNGRSDHLPKGVRYTVIDLVPTIAKVVQHFKWNKFIYIGHSLGVPIGKFFNIAYPGHITRMVELDPVPAHHTWPTTLDGIKKWYHDYYGYYKDERFAKYNGGNEHVPKYTYESAREKMMNVRGLTEVAADHILERCLEPVSEGLYRFTFDQRMKEVTILPFSGELLEKIYTQIKTPTFSVIAQGMIDLGMYADVPFVMNEEAWPHDNYRFKIVQGGHDVHIYNPECMADDIFHFLLDELKAKL